MTPDDFRTLVSAGLSTDQIAVVMEIMAREASIAVEAEEDRKAKQRARWAKHQKNKQNANVSQCEPMLANVPRASVTRVEDKPLPQKKTEEKEQEGRKSAPVRATRLPSDWSLPAEWRDDAIEAGLSEHLIDLEASKMRDWSLSAKNGAKLNWRASWRNWCRGAAANLPRGSPSQRAPELADVFKMVGRRLTDERQEREDSSGFRAAIPHLRASGTGDR